MFRIGYGYDVHEFDENRPLIIGGIEIEHTKDSKGIAMQMYCYTLLQMLF